MGELFGTDGIRGRAYHYPVDADTAFRVGRAVAQVLGRPGHSPRVLIGRDTRISGRMLEQALEAGIVSAGGEARLLGVIPTPGVAYLTRDLEADAGVVVSASHNPYQDNGMKIFSGQGFKLPDAKEEEIEGLVLDGGSAESYGPESGLDGCQEDAYLGDASERYAAFLKQTFAPTGSLQGFRIVLDTANGATHRVAPAVFRGLGADVSVIHDAPDGRNINEGCGSQHTEDLQRAVVETGAALGLAFDGDGDRLIAVDETGRALTGDQVLVICSRMLKRQGKLKNDLLVSTVMSNMGLQAACRQYGFRHRAAKVGDRYVLEEMQRLDAALGGEDSGHIIFLEHHTTGDGILAGLQVVAAMLEAERPLSELATLMTVFPQILINVHVRSKPDLKSVPAITEAIARAETALKNDGRALVRYSGTEDLCRVMVEGPTEAVAQEWAEILADAVRTALG